VFLAATLVGWTERFSNKLQQMPYKCEITPKAIYTMAICCLDCTHKVQSFKLSNMLL